MRFDIEALRELPGVLSGRLPGPLDVGDLTDAELTGSLSAVGGARRELDASAALLAAEAARRSARDLGTGGLAQRRGHKDGAGLVEELAGLSRGEAAKLVRVGSLLETAHTVAPVRAPTRVDSDEGAADGTSEAPTWAPPPRDIAALRGLPGPWDAAIAVSLRNRWLTAAHSDALRSGLSAPRTPQSDDEWRRATLELIADCWTAQWSPEDLARAAKRMRGALDGAAACAEARNRYEARSLRRHVRASGMVHYDVDLDPESDARFYGPIKRLLSPRFGGPRFTSETDREAATVLEADPRTNEQLQADTLVELVGRAVAAAGSELFKTGEPQVMVAVTTADLATAREAHELLHRHHGGDHSGCSTAAGSIATDSVCPGPDAGIAWVNGRDEPVTATDAMRLICAGGYTPVLFDETGQAIDLGKDQRFFTRRQRRAFAARDGGCLYPSCDRPPEDCEGHHINPWAKHPSHRKSETRDGVLLCRRHHKMVHDHGSRVERRGGDYWLHWPGNEPVLLPSKAGVQTELRRATASVTPLTGSANQAQKTTRAMSTRPTRETTDAARADAATTALARRLARTTDGMPGASRRLAASTSGSASAPVGAGGIRRALYVETAPTPAPSTARGEGS